MTADVEMLPELVDEGLDFFNLAGDEGDKLYVRAIRQHIAAKDAEIEALRAEVNRFRALEAEAAEFVEVPIINRTKFTGDEPYVGWRGLGQSLNEALDERDALRAEVERLNAELSRLEVIAGYGGVSSDAPERLILASEVYDGVQSCDKWCDVRRVVDDGQPMPESATAYVRADRAERLAEALRDAADDLERGIDARIVVAQARAAQGDEAASA